MDPARPSPGGTLSVAGGDAGQEDRTWQRLDKWLWCARFMKARSDCARLVAAGSVRINRQVTDKPHAKLRPGDVLTLPLPREVRVVRVLSLAARRGPAAEARALYEEIAPAAPGPGESDPAAPAPGASASGAPTPGAPAPEAPAPEAPAPRAPEAGTPAPEADQDGLRTG